MLVIMNTNTEEIKALIISRRVLLNERNKTSYHRRSLEKRNIKIIPIEFQKKRGRKQK